MMRFHFKPPAGVETHKDYRGQTLQEAQKEIKELREWLAALTEQLEFVIGKDEKNGNKNN